jgi:transcriptional regulator with XRE-family HTH domain
MHENLGEKIRAARRSARLTQAQLAERLGCTEGYIAHIEHGRSLPSDVKLLQLCDALNLDKREMLRLRQLEKASHEARPFFFDAPPAELTYFRGGDRLTREQMDYALRVIHAAENNRKFKAILDVMLEEEENAP